MMLLTLILLHFFHFTSISYGIRLYNSTLLKLINITDSKLEGLGFLNLHPDNPESESRERIENPLLPNLPNTCKKKSENPKRPRFSSFPKFQKIYSNCRKKFRSNATCFATCIFYGIITKEKYYGTIFVYDIKLGNNVHYEKSAPFPHLAEREFSNDENVFCFSKEFRETLLSNIVTCKLLSSTEFCIIDENALHCDPDLGNCNFDVREASVISSGNYAHLVTCGTLDTIKWKYFESSSKLQCILPGKRKLLTTNRKVFKDCHVCSKNKDGKNEAVIEFARVPAKEEFSQVVYSARPIVIRNGTSFEGIPPLNFSVLKSIYQDFLGGNWKPCNLQMYDKPFKSFSRAFSKMSKGRGAFYMRWGVCDGKIRKRFGNIIKTRLSFLPDDYPKVVGAPWVYASSPGDGSGFHYDYYHEMTWQAQLSGIKRWRIGPPPECNHICTEFFEVTVYPGDFILMYTNTWLHGVVIEGTDPSLAIGIEYELKE